MEFDLTKVSLANLLAFIGSTGILSAIFTSFLNGLCDKLKDNRKTRRAATYAALRLAVIMERYALKCARRHSDIDTSHNVDGYASKCNYTLPEIEIFPDDIDWKSLDADYSASVLSFPNKIELWNCAIEFAGEHARGAEEDGSWECGGYCAIQGYEAWGIAVSLRHKYGIAPITFLDGMWDIGQYLQQRSGEFCNVIDRKHKESEKRQKDLTELLEENRHNT